MITLSFINKTCFFGIIHKNQPFQTAYSNSFSNMAQKTSVEQDRQRSQLLKKQLNQMAEDYEFMKKNKQEWKKQLDARFQDIEKKIQTSKQFITNEAKRTNDTLLAFQHKFEFELKKTKDQLQTNIDNLNKQTTANFTKKSEEIAQLNKDLQDEKNNRNSQFEDGMKDNKQRMDKLNDQIQKQKQNRIKSEKQNMGKINQSLFLIKEQLKQQKDERNLKIKQLQKHTDYELASQRKFNQQFHNKTFNQFKESLGQLRTQMEARFNSKDQIINSISKIVKTIQDTLRHPN